MSHRRRVRRHVASRGAVRLLPVAGAVRLDGVLLALSGFEILQLLNIYIYMRARQAADVCSRATREKAAICRRGAAPAAPANAHVQGVPCAVRADPGSACFLETVHGGLGTRADRWTSGTPTPGKVAVHGRLETYDINTTIQHNFYFHTSRQRKCRRTKHVVRSISGSHGRVDEGDFARQRPRAVSSGTAGGRRGH